MDYDLSSLEELFGKDSDDFKDILKSFIYDYNQRYPLLEKAIKERDFEQIAKQSHAFKSVVGNFNLFYLMELAKKIEIFGKNKILQDEESTLDALFIKFSEGLKDFKQYIEQRYDLK
ncbi:MAG: Hpt domain-containing protein [candidate division WOR-3 bacterium]|jgi:HPt (histidine-containing phosphotransfer) domain-containing protein